MSRILKLKSLAVAALLTFSGLSQASFTAVTSETAFRGMVATWGIDSLDDLVGNVDQEVLATLARTTTIGASYGYAANTSLPGDNNKFFVAPYPIDKYLSPSAQGPILLTGFSTDVKAIGGYFFATGDLTPTGGLELLLGLTLTVVATDVNGVSFSSPFIGVSATSFLGFVSTVPLRALSIEISAASVGYPTVNNLYLASAVAAVPELRTWAMMLAGLGCVGVSAGRRRRD